MTATSVSHRRSVLVALTTLLLVVPACVREDQVTEVSSEPAPGGGGSEAAAPGSEPAAAGSEPSGSEAAAPEGGGGERLSIATGGTSGVYFVYGGGIAEQITANLEGYEATAEATSASVDNMLLVGDGGSDIGFTLADTAADGINGEDAFTEPVEAQALANVYDNVNHVVTLAGSGIASVEDLRGRRVSVGSPNSGTEVTALRVLEAAGIDADADLERLQLGVAESVQAVRDGTADAFFWSGGLPTGGVTDLASTDEIAILPLTDQLATLQETYGDVYQETAIPADAYPGLAEDVATIGVPNYLVVSPDMDEQLAYDLVALLFDQQEALTQVHPEAGNLELERGADVEPLELHPGAQRYFDENG